MTNYNNNATCATQNGYEGVIIFSLLYIFYYIFHV